MAGNGPGDEQVDGDVGAQLGPGPFVTTGPGRLGEVGDALLGGENASRVTGCLERRGAVPVGEAARVPCLESFAVFACAVCFRAVDQRELAADPGAETGMRQRHGRHPAIDGRRAVRWCQEALDDLSGQHRVEVCGLGIRDPRALPAAATGAEQVVSCADTFAHRGGEADLLARRCQRRTGQQLDLVHHRPARGLAVHGHLAGVSGIVTLDAVLAGHVLDQCGGRLEGRGVREGLDGLGCLHQVAHALPRHVPPAGVPRLFGELGERDDDGVGQA